tara:strand:+ start:1005 stop:2240 length:1236 start_codon:yes stop_codon:yes gene_type:complete
MTNAHTSKKVILILIPILSLIFGFLIEEDLSTGGSRIDFIRTFPAVINFSNFIFNTTHEYTRHFPFHYFLLSIPQNIFNNIFITKLIYFLFSLLLPFLVYLNISKLYPNQKFNSFIIGVSLLFLPFYRASSIWPNAHLTALIFLLFANYFYTVNLNSKNFTYKFLNIFFLSLSTYSMQSYAVFFIFYLAHYYKNNSINLFLSILFFCVLFSFPGFYILLGTSISSKLDFTNNLSYTIVTNFSIIFFCLLFFLINKNNFIEIKKSIISLKKYEIIMLLLFFSFLLFTYENFSSSGGGFFYKISNFIFHNNLFFYLTSFFGLIIFYLLYKIDRDIFYIILLVNFTAIGYATSQKYFEPTLIILIFVLNKNFFSKNLVSSNFNTLIFYMLSFAYFVIALINNNYELSKSLIINY